MNENDNFSFLLQLRRKIILGIVTIDSIKLSILSELLNLEIDLLAIDYTLGNIDLIGSLCAYLDTHQEPSFMTDEEFMTIIMKTREKYVTIIS